MGILKLFCMTVGLHVVAAGCGFLSKKKKKRLRYMRKEKE